MSINQQNSRNDKLITELSSNLDEKITLFQLLRVVSNLKMTVFFYLLFILSIWTVGFMFFGGDLSDQSTAIALDSSLNVVITFVKNLLITIPLEDILKLVAFDDMKLIDKEIELLIVFNWLREGCELLKKA